MEPTVTVYDGTKYIIKYDFEHMTYIISSKTDDSFLVTTRHYHKLIGWLTTYGELTSSEIYFIGSEITKSFKLLVGDFRIDE